MQKNNELFLTKPEILKKIELQLSLSNDLWKLALKKNKNLTVKSEPESNSPVIIWASISPNRSGHVLEGQRIKVQAKL